MPTYIKPLIATSLALPITYAVFTSTRLYSPPSSHPITSALSVSPSFASSHSVTKIINPRGFKSRGDSRSVTLRLPASPKGLGDEELLARLMRGFWGGWAFAPERAALGLLGLRWTLVDYPRQREKSVQPKDVWKRSEISSEKLPDVDEVWFGGFQVIGKKIASADEDESYIDFAYGRSGSGFAGVHRFSIEHEDNKEDVSKEEQQVRITMSCVTCNARRDKVPGSGWLWTFHRTYSMLLFREGVAEVLRRF
jgi:hypothetical protein